MKAADRTNITNLTAHKVGCSWLVSVAFLLCGWNVGTAANRKCAYQREYHERITGNL